MGNYGHSCMRAPGPLRELDAWLAPRRAFRERRLDALAARIVGRRQAGAAIRFGFGPDRSGWWPTTLPR